MKNFYFILFSSLIFVSCSNNYNDTSFELNGNYMYNIPNCDNGGNPEIHCILSVNFVDDFTVSPISITGGDIFYETNYSVNNGIIKLNKSSKFNFNVSFEIINNSTLKRIEDDTIWLKDE